MTFPAVVDQKQVAVSVCKEMGKSFAKQKQQQSMKEEEGEEEASKQIQIAGYVQNRK